MIEISTTAPSAYPFWWTFLRYSCYWISPLLLEGFTLYYEIQRLPRDSGAGFFFMAYLFALPQAVLLALAAALVTTLATRRMSRGTPPTRQVLGWLQKFFLIVFALVLVAVLAPATLHALGFNF